MSRVEKSRLGFGLSFKNFLRIGISGQKKGPVRRINRVKSRARFRVSVTFPGVDK